MRVLSLVLGLTLCSVSFANQSPQIGEVIRYAILCEPIYQGDKNLTALLQKIPSILEVSPPSIHDSTVCVTVRYATRR